MQRTQVKPSAFPRDEKFRDPTTPPFRDVDGNYHVFSYEDVMRVLLNREEAFSRDPAPWLPPGVRHMGLDFMWVYEPFMIDGKAPRHDLLRSVVDPWFRTREVRKLDGFIRGLTVDLINGVVLDGDGEFDLATELAYRLSLRVICSLLGFDTEQEPWLRKKLNEFNQAPSFDKLPRQFDVEAFLWEMIAERIVHPRGEMLDTIIDAWKQNRITGRDLLGYIFGMIAAGTDTTGATLVNAFGLLAEFGKLDDARAMGGDVEALRRVVEEILRFGTVFPTKPLYVLKDSTFGQLTVPEGSVLYVWYAAANRDEAVNAGIEQSSPHVFDITRWPNRHVGLGWGKHFCLGGDLARLETRILIEEALHRLPGLELDETKPFARFAGIVDGVTEAPFRYDQEAAESIMRLEPAATQESRGWR
jgi:cytochrome P450